MKVSKKWIEQYAAIPVSVEEYQQQMILHGTGIEGVEDLSATVHGVVVGRILSIMPHTNSDHMLICQVDVGDQQVQIVTGAQNIQVGDLVPVALEGATLPGGKRIRASKLRGELSQGMLCAGPELGVPVDLYPSVGDAGILVFQEEHPLGVDVKSILGIDDAVIDFEILANRPDCQCVWGVARETAAIMGTAFRKPDISVDVVPGTVEEYVRIQVEDEALCPRYVGRVVKNVRIAPSPMWMRAALHAAGVRSINNIVDITNYVMLETGHPMHAFDLEKVRDAHIIVRRARPGEALRTLDGKLRELTPEMLVISDQTAATGIAGIMGGEESEITDQTATLLFECAAFDRTSVRITSRSLGMRTESSGRFEKGVCPATAREAMDRACQLVRMLDAGEVVEGIYDHYPHPVLPQEITASVARISRRAGVEIPAEDMVRILSMLHFKATLQGDMLRAYPPIFRQDIDGEADLCEEVLRIYGYHHLKPTTLRGETTLGGRSPRVRMRDQVKRILVGMGYYEVVNFSFVSPKWVAKLQLSADDPRQTQLKLLNPLGEDTSVMRSSLVPSMFNVLSFNHNHSNAEALLFETAPVFDNMERKAGELPQENWMLCVGAYGDTLDFYHLRSVVIELFRQFGIEASIEIGGEPYHHPGRSATLYAQGQVVATLGEVHPDVGESFDLPRRALLAEVHLEQILALQKPLGRVNPLPRFPAITRDLALVMDEGALVGKIQEAIQQAGGELLERVEVFDVYRGAQVLTGRKSVAFSLTFRDTERTLSDADVVPLFERIVATCAQKFDAYIRS